MVSRARRQPNVASKIGSASDDPAVGGCVVSEMPQRRQATTEARRLRRHLHEALIRPLPHLFRGEDTDVFQFLANRPVRAGHFLHPHLHRHEQPRERQLVFKPPDPGARLFLRGPQKQPDQRHRIVRQAVQRIERRGRQPATRVEQVSQVLPIFVAGVAADHVLQDPSHGGDASLHVRDRRGLRERARFGGVERRPVARIDERTGEVLIARSREHDPGLLSKRRIRELPACRIAVVAGRLEQRPPQAGSLQTERLERHGRAARNATGRNREERLFGHLDAARESAHDSSPLRETARSQLQTDPGIEQLRGREQRLERAVDCDQRQLGNTVADLLQRDVEVCRGLHLLIEVVGLQLPDETKGVARLRRDGQRPPPVQ